MAIHHKAPLNGHGARFFLSLLAVASLLTAAHAQSVQLLQPNKLPSCAESCVPLTDAVTTCTPPTLPVSNRATYNECFCTSPILEGLYSSANGICDGYCQNDQTALEQIQGWYIGYCQQSGGTAPGAPTTSVATTTTPTSAATSVVAVPGDGSTGLIPSDETGSTWVSDHWQWILYLIIVILAIVGLSVLLRWLRQRHRRKQQAMHQNASSEAFPSNGHPNISQPQMSVMSGANHSDPTVPPPAIPKQRSRTASLRNSVQSFSASRDNIVPGRMRSNSRPTSTVNAAPIVWGPHQNQAHSQGYGYVDNHVEVPTPVGHNYRNSTGPHQYGFSGEGANPKDTLREEEEEVDSLPSRPHTAEDPIKRAAQGLRRKLSKKKG